MAKQAMSSLEKYIRMLKRLGFRQVLEIPFSMPDNRGEKLFVLYQKRGAILLVFETRLGAPDRGNFYYNWRRRISETRLYGRKRRLLCSGHWSSAGKRDVFVGSHYLPAHDVRAVTRRLESCGKFVSPWVESQRIMLAHSGDPHTQHEAITAKRIKMLPRCVRRALLL